MTLTASYDPTLSRVRINGTGLGILNANPFFESNTTGWVANGGTVARSTVRSHEGVASALLTPSGSSGTPSLELTTSAAVPVTAGASYVASAWVYSTVGDTVTAGLVWLDGANNVQLTIGPDTVVPANTWTQVAVSADAPVGAVKGGPRVRMPNTPAATDLLYIDEAIIRPTGATFTVERSVNGSTWTPVRGAISVPVSGSLTGAVDDYEFVPDMPNTYRARVLNNLGVTVQTHTSAGITPTLDAVWIKSVPRPFLNRPVTVVDFSEVQRPARNGVFDVVGRSLPVAVTDVRGSRRYELTVLVDDQADADEFDQILAAGDPVFVHVPTDSLVPASMYAVIGDTTRARVGRTSRKVTFDLPLTEVAAPGPDVAGETILWTSVVTASATWQAVVAGDDTWLRLLEGVGSPADVIVS